MDMTLVVPVTNTSAVDGDEVVQLYVRKVEDKEGPKLALRGYSRQYIPAGTSVNVSIPLNELTFRTFNEATGKMEATPGTYVLYYGKSSDLRDLQQIIVTL